MANNGWLSKNVLPSKVEQGDRRVTIRFGVNETRWDTSVLWDLNRELLVDLGNKTIRVGSGCAQGCSASCTGGCTGSCVSTCTAGCSGSCRGNCGGGCSACSGPS